MKAVVYQIVFCLIIMGFWSCSGTDSPEKSGTARRTEASAEKEGTGSTAGSPADRLQSVLAEKVPELNADATSVLLRTSAFNITIADLMENLSQNLGRRISRFTNADPDQIKSNIKSHAERLAVQRIVLNRARTAGYTAEDSKVADEVARVSQPYGGIDAYKSQLTQHGISYEFVRRDIRKTVIINNYLREKLGPAFDNQSRRSELINKYVSGLKAETGFTFILW